MAFKNQIQPGVDNQLNSATGANAMGLRMPWGQAMFNLPRFQMPGTTANFGGGFGFPPDGQDGQGGQIAPMGVRFSVQRQASSDPVANIVNDISNPLSSTNVNFTPQAAAPAAPLKLKQQMVGGLSDAGSMGPTAPQAGGGGGGGWGQHQGYTGMAQNAPENAYSYSPELAGMYGNQSPAQQQQWGAGMFSPNAGNMTRNSQFGPLRGRMTGFI